MKFWSIFSISDTFEKSDFFIYRKARLLNFLLILSIASFFQSTLMNFFVLDQFKIALTMLFFCLLLSANLFYFRTTYSIDTPSMTVVLSIGFILIVVFFNGKGLRDAGSWLIIFPLVAYQLLTTKMATYLFVAFTLVVTVTIGLNQETWGLEAPKATLLNVTASLIFGGAIVYYLEMTVEKSLQSLHVLSTKDALTNTSNRMTLLNSMHIEIKRSLREHKSFSLIMFDIDHFKNINDTYGHQVGDVVLIEFTTVIENAVRETDILGRWGGEEFILILPNTRLDRAKNIAEKILAQIRQHQFSSIGKLTSSAGVIEFRRNESAEESFDRVDKLLYKAKESGRNCFIAEN